MFLFFAGFPPMIAEAKQLALQPENNAVHSAWQKSNNEVSENRAFYLDERTIDCLVDRCDWQC